MNNFFFALYKMNKIPISKRVLKQSIGAYYKVNKVPRKSRTKYGSMNASQLLNLASKLKVVDSKKYRIYNKKTSHLPKIKRGERLKGSGAKKRKKRVVKIGINDLANKSKTRITSDKKKWAKNKRFYDFEGIDTGKTVKELKIIAKRRGIARYSTMRKKQLINAIAKTERVEK